MDDKHVAFLQVSRDSRLCTPDQKNYTRNVYHRLIDYVHECNRLRLKERHDIEKDMSVEEAFRTDLGVFEPFKPDYYELGKIAVEYGVCGEDSFMHPMMLARFRKGQEYKSFVHKEHENFPEIISTLLGEELSSDIHIALSQATNKAVWHLEQEVLLENMANCRSYFLTMYSNTMRYHHHEFGIREVWSLSAALKFAASMHKLDFMKLHVASQRWSRSLYHSSLSERFHDYCFVEARKPEITDLFQLADFSKDNLRDIPYFPRLHNFLVSQQRD